MEFSDSLQKKIDTLKARRPTVSLGSIQFSSPLLLAPMSAICNAPYRLLMEQLGAGGTVSELISCHGINHGNARTREMLRLDPREKNVGIQLFGEDADAMAKACAVASEVGPKFIDINMGCPVRKVVNKGGGSALLKSPEKLGDLFNKMKAATTLPITIKIRTGWDDENRNALEVIRIAKEEGIEFVAIHGRTRTQAYRGSADWDFLENTASLSPLPIIGNGDLHNPDSVKKRIKSTSCHALMLGRGPLRNPFIFLESFIEDGENIYFTPQDYWEVINTLYQYIFDSNPNERTRLIQLRKFIVWMAAGLSGVAKFREQVLTCFSLEQTMKLTEEFFNGLGTCQKVLDSPEQFMSSGHG